MSCVSDPGRLVEWRERFRRFSSSGLAVARFCARERVSVAAFYHWRKKLGPEARRPRRCRRPGVFQQVGVVASASAVSVQLPGGARIEVRAADLDAVRAVVAEVARADRDLKTSTAPC
jgi:hypothetical protein